MMSAIRFRKEDRSSGNALADILNRYLPNYRKSNRLSLQQWKIVKAIQGCRTEKMGGHLNECNHCDYREIGYNSCSNRHCNKCQANRRFEWIRRQLGDVFPIPYYHLVFTLPHELNDLALCNKRLIYDLFFRCASETLKSFGRDQKYLGAEIGFISILHTWGQSLCYHVHLHMIVTGGGLCKQSNTWKRLPYQKKFIFPVKALSKKLRGKFLYHLRGAYQDDELVFPGKLEYLSHLQNFEQFIDSLYQKAFYTYAKKPFAGARAMVKYLGNYTNKVAISNSRILNIDNHEVTFRYKDYRDGHKQKIMTLSATNFIRRFLYHSLPGGFRKIRYYGILLKGRNQAFESARRLLIGEEKETSHVAEKTPVPCPECGKGFLKMVKRLTSIQVRIARIRQAQQFQFAFDSS